MSIRPIKRLIKAQPTMEGAGVRLRRAFGFGGTDDFDPFLLLDDFRGETPEDYRAGFPWHPHRGIETITYVLAGEVAHGDSLGGSGVIGAGDVQWMTAGSGIIHQEMPHGDAGGRMHGFQLWANLPSALKMTAPRYQEVKAGEIPEVVEDDGTRVRVICGDLLGSSGPVDGIAAARITGNGLAEGGEQWVTGPSLGVTAAGPLVGGGTLERDVDIPVSPGNSLTLTHYVTTNITGDGSIEVVFE